jgi:hypothetical protein
LQSDPAASDASIEVPGAAAFVENQQGADVDFTAGTRERRPAGDPVGAVAGFSGVCVRAGLLLRRGARIPPAVRKSVDYALPHYWAQNLN